MIKIRILTIHLNYDKRLHFTPSQQKIKSLISQPFISLIKFRSQNILVPLFYVPVLKWLIFC